MNHGSLFSGIGGFDLASRWCGWNNVFQVENDKFCNKVLEKNFPGVKRYGDIKEFNGKEYEGKIDIISGGMPCQPFSIAGKRKGKEDDRYLWDEMLRVISEIKPSWVVAENVYGLISLEKGMVFNKVLSDLESAGYEIQPFVVPACAKNAPHRRDRIWIVAYSDQNIGRRACDSSKQINSNNNTKYREEHIGGNKLRKKGKEGKIGRSICNASWETNWIEAATSLCGVAHGVSNRVDRLKALGNAIVPQIAYEIFKAIDEIMNNEK